MYASLSMFLPVQHENTSASLVRAMQRHSCVYIYIYLHICICRTPFQLLVRDYVCLHRAKRHTCTDCRTERCYQACVCLCVQNLSESVLLTYMPAKQLAVCLCVQNLSGSGIHAHYTLLMPQPYQKLLSVCICRYPVSARLAYMDHTAALNKGFKSDESMDVCVCAESVRARHTRTDYTPAIRRASGS